MYDLRSGQQRVASMADNPPSFREGGVREKAPAVTLATYRAAKAFPTHELFAPTSPLRRAAASIPANIVEGLRKRTTPDTPRFYNIAHGFADNSLPRNRA